jgi:hypothetical protein
MNRKKKINELCKGLFKNNKSSRLIDLKPLEDENFKSKKDNIIDISYSKNKNKFIENDFGENNNPKNFKINIKVAKNMGFGAYFKKIRQDIVEKFKLNDELINNKYMSYNDEIKDLFNINNSNSKNSNYYENTNKNIKYDFSKNNSTNSNILTENFNNYIKYENNNILNNINNQKDELIYQNNETELKWKKIINSKIHTNIFNPNLNSNINIYEQNSLNNNSLKGNNIEYFFTPENKNN